MDIIMEDNGDEGESRGKFRAQREPGELRTGGAGPLNMAPELRARQVAPGVPRVKGFKARNSG